MRAFLEEVAELIVLQKDYPLDQVHIVLPTRRSCMYMKHFLMQFLEGITLAPKIIALDDFVHEVSGLDILDTASLCFSLFEVHKKIDPEVPSLEDFTPLAIKIINDFDLIDRALDHGDKIFSLLSDSDAIDLWAEQLGTPFSASSSAYEYFTFWSKLKSSYLIFKENLLSQGQAYSGLAYRYLCENMEQCLDSSGVKMVYFVGLNQLHIAEHHLLRSMVLKDRARCFWDLDVNYLQVDPEAPLLYAFRKFYEENDPQEDGLLYGKKTLIQDYLTNGDREVSFYSVSNHVTQAKTAASLLVDIVEKGINTYGKESFQKKKNYVAVILPDEMLLTPLMHALPENKSFPISDWINITMGLSMRHSAFYKLITAIFKAQNNMYMDMEGNQLVFFKDILRILSHPFVKSLVIEDQNPPFRIRKEGLIYIPFSSLKNSPENGKMYQLLFTFWHKDADLMLQHLEDLCEGLIGPNPICTIKDSDAEYIYEFSLLLKRARALQKQYPQEDLYNSLRKILLDQMAEIQIPFTTSPIKPIQIMGMLESRALDFEHVIVLSCNEGDLPKGRTQQSAIPFDLRKEYQLPTYENKDQAIAYTFFRLFHRSREIHLIYNTVGLGNKPAEKSRFLIIIKDLFQKPPFENFVLKEKTVQVELPNQNVEVPLKKGPVYFKRLKKILSEPEKGISPSAIQAYIRSPYEFFRDRILEVSSNQELHADINAKIFGNVIHQVMEDLLKPFVNNWLDSEDVQGLLLDEEKIEQLVSNAINIHAGGVLQEKGRNFILKKVAGHLIPTFLDWQLEQGRVYLAGLEKDLETNLILDLPGEETINIVLRGKVDRIEYFEKENSIRIIDYKTGTKGTKFDIKSIHSVFLEEDQLDKLQPLLYKYVLLKNLQDGILQNFPEEIKGCVTIQSGFYLFKSSKQSGSHKFYPVEMATKSTSIDDDDFIKEIERNIKNIFRDMLNPDIPITQNTTLNELL